MIEGIATLLVAGPLLLALYTYAGYPLVLWLVGRRRPPLEPPPDPQEWPLVSITVPVYNEVTQIRGTLESLLSLDYPSSRRQILVVSDASTDGTDSIVESYQARGVELLRLPTRGGKGTAENAAAPHLRGEIVINTDASIRIQPGALKPLVRWFADPQIGLVSGRDVSVAKLNASANAGESGYVGYEMWIRALESRVAGIVGASGCFYGIRAHLHRAFLPNGLSRDFAAAMTTFEHGYRSISADDAICLVPRTTSLHREYRRKVRTITRGIQTLTHKRHLLNPFSGGAFAWMLLSHKVARWFLPWMVPPALLGITLFGIDHSWARALLAVALALVAVAAIGYWRADDSRLPRPFAMLGYLLASNFAAAHAAVQALTGASHRLWEPTRRDALTG